MDLKSIVPERDMQVRILSLPNGPVVLMARTTVSKTVCLGSNPGWSDLILISII